MNLSGHRNTGATSPAHNGRATYRAIPAAIIAAVNRTATRNMQGDSTQTSAEPLQGDEVTSCRRAAQSQQERQSLCHLCRALDRSGKGLLRIDSGHQVEWMLGRAEQWLEDYFPARRNGSRRALPEPVRDWLTRKGAGRQEKSNGKGDLLAFRRGGRRLRIRRVRRLGDDPGIWLLLWEEEMDHAIVLRGLGFTARESDILLWLAEAKSNPEIGAILGTSRHTVRKHVEHILAKLKVESRGAAAMRVRELLGGLRNLQ